MFFLFVFQGENHFPSQAIRQLTDQDIRSKDILGVTKVKKRLKKTRVKIKKIIDLYQFQNILIEEKFPEFYPFFKHEIKCNLTPTSSILP